MKAVLFTALYGHYFDAVPPLPPQGVDAVCFTDDAHLSVPGWDVRVVERPEPTPRLRAKWFKINPHECLPECDASIWIDAGWQVNSPDFAEQLLQRLREPLVFFPHRWHKTIAQELAASTHPKMAAYPLAEQVQCYLDQGMPADVPVQECTCIVRRHNDPCAREVAAAWWWENKVWSECDQLSLPFVLWKTGARYARLPFTLAEQPWISLAHWRAD